jgi:hypothetical protein
MLTLRALARELRGQVPGLPVLFVSGFAPSALDEGEGDGCRFLTKPFSASQFARAVDELCDGSSVFEGGER